MPDNLRPQRHNNRDNKNEREDLYNNADDILLGRRQRRLQDTRRQAENFRQPERFVQSEKSKTPRKKKRPSILKIIFMTLLLIFLLATGAVSAGVAWYVVKLSEDLPSMILKIHCLRSYMIETVL